MVKIEAIIRPHVLDKVKAALNDLGVNGMTVTEVRGAGKQKGYSAQYRGAEYSVNLLPKIKLEIVVNDENSQDVIDAIILSAKTGVIGDGKIFLTHVTDVIRIRTDDRGEAAL